MPHITIEYVILLPVLILQIFLFPLSASLLMNVWIDSRRTLALQEVTSHIGSSIQQLYFALNHTAVTADNVRHNLDVPPFIENHHYVGNATLKPLNASKLLELTFRLVGAGITAKATVILGPNAVWKPSTFISNSTNACITAEKLADGTIRLGFGG
ncbi:MAG: hypothetical protein QXI91_02765 [Candidatus Bathyarchaeia archaeon]